MYNTCQASKNIRIRIENTNNKTNTVLMFIRYSIENSNKSQWNKTKKIHFIIIK